jgi:putative acetyltransferase
MIHIRPMEPDRVAEARQLILSVAGRIFEPEAVEQFIANHAHELTDVENYRHEYGPPDGLFLAILDEDALIGTGAIRRLDDKTAELRRMWLLESYEGRGIGFRLTQELFTFARTAGYRQIRLTTSVEQARAIRFYERLGFYRIERYNESEGIFLEMKLDDQDLPEPT